MRKLMLCAATAALLAGCAKQSSGGNEMAAGNASATDNASAGKAGGGKNGFIITKVALPGEGRGDYLTVDPDARRLYVTHAEAVHILDLDSLKPIGEVTGLKKSAGVALAGGRAFVTDAGGNTVVQFDPASGKTLKVIPAGKKPDSILHDPASGDILAFDGDGSEVSVIDPAKAAVVKTIKLPAAPEFSQTDGKGKAWVNMEEANAIAVIDTRRMALAGTIKLPGCDGPAPLAFDAANRVLFSGCAGNKVMAVVDADSGKMLASVPIGDDPDGIAFDAGRKRIVVANRKGGWTIVDQRGKADYSVAETLPIDEYAKTVTIDPRTHRIFSSTADLIWPAPTPGKKLLPNAKSGTFRLMVVSEQ